MQLGALLSGLALKVMANANQLRKWVELHRNASAAAALPKAIEAEATAFVPVVTIESSILKSVEATPELVPVHRRSSPTPTVTPPQAQLSVRLPNGIVIDLECSAHETPSVKVVIIALGSVHILTSGPKAQASEAKAR
ncbi:IS66 family insertion sequence element accessory protein TnpB [Burkholderia ubonensis]|uniref:IS66 family insertion sequence element accessory protein TnpB n=1 Tax=Burkholderia ubonensis TaxID=101571 RepID=UPI001E2C0C2B|nr:IS66 family insertion sequence element accessory protein TnpB [Burkholderia ubonensis]